MADFNTIKEFEDKIAEFFGAPYAVAVDSCTHGIELCLRYKQAYFMTVAKHTYLSVPMLAKKLGITLYWKDYEWTDYYNVFANIYDAAVLWRKDSYIDNSLMCLSFQYQKHLSLGRGGAILCPDYKTYHELKKMSYDGRLPDLPWREQNVTSMGYHYHMVPETAQMGLDKLQKAIETEPRKWNVLDWPDLTQMEVFK